VAQHKRIYTITATACNAAACPSANAATVAGLEYTERKRVVTACSLATGPNPGDGTGQPC
jgi:MSHA biogenesis protein MshP